MNGQAQVYPYYSSFSNPFTSTTPLPYHPVAFIQFPFRNLSLFLLSSPLTSSFVAGDGVAGGAQRRQDVGEIQLALRVVGRQRRERFEQSGAVEGEDRGVDLTDRELLGRRVATRLGLRTVPAGLGSAQPGRGGEGP